MKWGKIVIALLALATLSACQHKPKAKKPTQTNTWSRMAKDVIQTQDGAKIIDQVSGQTAVDTMEGLYRYSSNRLKPALATTVVQPTNGGLTYTYHLRASEWRNGQPVTAQDFVYAWRRAVAPATESEYAYLFFGIKNADAIQAGKAKPETLGISAPDAHTLVVTLDHAIPYFNTMMVSPVFFPMAKATVAKYGAKYGTSSQTTMTNGPYTLRRWSSNDTAWTEVKNPRYWNAKNVHIKTIKTEVVKDSATALSLYRSGRLDDAILTGNLAQVYRKDKAYQGQMQGRTSFLDMNQKRVPAFANAKLRQAISLAINRPQFVDKVLRDGSIIARNLTPQGIAQNPKTGEDFAQEAARSSAGQYSQYDLARAKKLWRDGMHAVGKTTLHVTLLSDDTEQAKQTAVYLQSMLEKLPGLKIKLDPVSFKTRVTKSLAGNTQLVLSSWQGDYPDPVSFLDMYTTGNTYNFGGWSNAQYDALIQASKTTDAADATKRYNDLQQAQQLLTEQAGMVPLYQTVAAHLVSRNITGLTYTPANTYDYVGARIK